MRPIAFLLPLLLLTPALAQTQPQTYPIKLERPHKVGEVFDLTLHVENTTSHKFTPPAGQPYTNEQTLKGDLTGRLQITQIDTGGNAIGLTLTIKKFTTGTTIAAPENTILDIQRSETGVTIEPRAAARLTDEGRQVLLQIYTAQRKKPGGDDASMGSPTPRMPGDSWPVKTAAFVDPELLEADPKNIDSRMTLKSLETIAGIPAMRLVQTLTIKDFKSALPPDYILETSGINMEITSILPTDTAQPALELSSKTDMHFAARHNTAGNKVEITQRILTTQLMLPAK